MVNQRQPIILIVDDTPTNLSVLFNYLQQTNFKVLIAENGAKALQVVTHLKPDIILLDVMMPELDGFETCARLKADPDLADIPVIFMTALSDTVDKVKGLQLGAVDYITKPVEGEEVVVRIQTHLTMRRLQQDLEAQIAELDAFAHTVAHDLKTPLAGIVGYAQILKHEFSAAHVVEAKHLKFVDAIEHGSSEAVRIVDELLLLATVHRNQVSAEPVSTRTIIARMLHRVTDMITRFQAHLTMPDDWPAALGYAPWLEEVWYNYITNAIKYGGEPPHVELGADHQGETIRFWVRDNGNGLSPEAQANLFTEFNRLDPSRAEGHGLGLSIVRRIIEKLGGQVGVESEVGQGSLFYFELPAADENEG